MTTGGDAVKERQPGRVVRVLNPALCKRTGHHPGEVLLPEHNKIMSVEERARQDAEDKAWLMRVCSIIDAELERAELAKGTKR